MDHAEALVGFEHETAEPGRKVLRVGTRPWNVRIVYKGETYGLDDRLEHCKDDPLVEFYDGRHVGRNGTSFPGSLGQFVSRYSVSTLTGQFGYAFHRLPRSRTGLSLDGSVPEWSVGAEDMAEVMAWLAELGYPENPNP